MKLFKIGASIVPDYSFASNMYRLELTAKTLVNEYRTTQLLDEEHLVSLFDRVFNALKEEMRYSIEKGENDLSYRQHEKP